MRTLAVRLTPGTDLKAELIRLVETHGLRAAAILSGVGSLSQAKLRLPSAAGEPDALLSLDEPTEILSLAGTLSPDGLHVHVALARRDGAVVGGHLVSGCTIHTTAELVIGELTDLEFRRPLDPATGYGELSVGPRDA